MNTPTAVPAGYSPACLDGSARGAFNATTGALLVDQGGMGTLAYANMANGNANNALGNIACRQIMFACNVAFTWGQNHGNATMPGIANTVYIANISNADQIWIDTIASGGLLSYVCFS